MLSLSLSLATCRISFTLCSGCWIFMFHLVLISGAFMAIYHMKLTFFFIFYHRQRYACVTCHCDDLIYKLKIFYFTYSFFLICLHTNTDYNTPTHRQTQSNLDISFPLKPRMNCSSSCLVIYLSPLVVLF